MGKELARDADVKGEQHQVGPTKQGQGPAS